MKTNNSVYRISFNVRVYKDNEHPQTNELVTEIVADSQTSAVVKFEEALCDLVSGKCVCRRSIF